MAKQKQWKKNIKMKPNMWRNWKWMKMATICENEEEIEERNMRNEMKINEQWKYEGIMTEETWQAEIEKALKRSRENENLESWEEASPVWKKILRK